jgi:ligand-binding sensor domain-containing protein/serine phosphatase RsbU (regulator of sigma subunit)
MKFLTWPVLLFCFICNSAFAQHKPFKTNKASQFSYRDNAKYNVKYIDVEHGLSSSFIKAISEDSIGNLLLGTWGGGLMKYDGISIDIYNTYSELPDNIINSIEKFGTHHRILFNLAGLYDYYKGKFTPLKLNNDSFYISRQFTVNKETWFIANDTLLFKLNKGNNLISLNKTMQIPYCKVFQATKYKNNLWLSSNKGLIKINESGAIEIINASNGISSNKVSYFVIRNDSMIYSCPDGVFIYDFKNYCKPLLYRNKEITSVNSIICDKKNNVWISTFNNGVFRWNGNEFIHLDITNGLTNNEIWAIYCDKFDNVWIGPRGGGLCRFDGDYVQHFDISDGLNGKVVWALAYSTEQKLHYFGTIGGGVNIYNGENFVSAPFNNKLPDLSIRSLFCDSKQNLWIGTIKGIAVYTKEGKLINYSTNEEIGDITIFKFYEDKDGVIWINHTKGLHCFKNGKFYKPFGNLFPDYLYYTISTCITKSGEKWIGNDNGAIAIDKNNKQLFKSFTDSISSIGFCVIEDKAGRILVGTRKGIYVKDGAKEYKINELNGLSSDIVWSLGEDKEGAIWAGTEFGLSKITFTKDSYKIESVGMLQGFTGGDCTQNGLVIDDKGIFWWGTSKKLTRFDPSRYGKKGSKPILQFRNILLNYLPTTFLETNKSDYTYSENHLTFQVSAIDWGNEKNLKYQYYLVGFDEDWSPSTTEDKVTYSNLAAGSYTMQIKSISNTGEESDLLEYAFVIKPAFWQTLWFKLLLAAIVIGGFVAFYKYRTYSLVKKRKILESIVKKRTEEVVMQKEVVEEKNKEILDSINYAKRLQEAILPPLKLVQKHLEQSFITYIPKDIVAGDFYWFETKGDLLFFAAADCTGHGVPGAMVSVVCSNALNRTVKEFGITESGKILDKVRELVVETFEKSESDVMDGMDISICVLNKKEMELCWSGANNPLWIIRKTKDSALPEFIEVKPDKQPIGKTEHSKPFTTHKIKLQTNDCIYVFTDGYVDQFGGEGGKKYKSANFKNFLLSIQDKNLAEQGNLINKNFDNWRGKLEQIDDVCVIGVKITD